MEKEKRERLEKAGWRVGSTQEFLNLTDEEAEIVESRLRQDTPPDPGRNGDEGSS